MLQAKHVPALSGVQRLRAQWEGAGLAASATAPATRDNTKESIKALKGLMEKSLLHLSMVIA